MKRKRRLKGGNKGKAKLQAEKILIVPIKFGSSQRRNGNWRMLEKISRDPVSKERAPKVPRVPVD
ncbi:hypothetical protein RUM43_011748 [Polyplax serrata]|uniref:Uncharacterized protein n=1 Tax=Polyplax serrata TaxID=468196 RepID=A0AAN8S9R5_POLSC